jgi:transposase
LTILYEDGLLLLTLRAKNNQMTLKLRNGMNNAAVFSEMVIRMVATGILRQGDVLILDNAATHHYQESTTLGDYLWYKHVILITFLPTRAPELNPIEQMWNILMQHLKNVALLGPG